MNLENRLPDETVNYSREHPLGEFAWLAVGVTAAIVVTVALLGYFAAELAARLPYAVERDLVAAHVEVQAPFADKAAEAAAQEVRALAARVAAVMELEPGMAIHVRYVDSPMVNAFATLGGQVFVHRGLVAKVPDENTLALVIAHEIAHVKLRHPVRSAGRGIAVGLLLAAVGLGGGPDIATKAGGVTLLSFSRSQEREADREALAALHRLYGHGGGPQDLFGLMGSEGRPDSTRVAMLQTHPLSAERVADLAAYAGERAWPADGPRTPLPEALKSHNVGIPASKRTSP